MTINHDSHDHDTDQPDECVCGEQVTDADKHRCLPIGWTEPVDLTVPPLFRFWGTPGLEAYTPDPDLPITIQEEP